MIKHYFLLTLAMVFSFAVFGQSIVTTTPQYQTAVLEEYTGIYCQYCPDGHLLAKELKADYPGQVILINIHQGGYASPNGTHPDFRTQWGNALAAQINLTGYPTGTVNRMIFPELNSSAMAINRSQWRPAARKVMEGVSPVNIGATTSYDAGNREITINVEAYYTGDAEQSTNLLNIALVQDSIPGPQTGGSTYNPGDILPNGQYKHDHMLRDLITGQWGDTIQNTSKGSLYTKTFTYTIPSDVNGVAVNPDKCHLAIFISEGKTDIRQGITVDIDSDSNDGNNAPFYGAFSGITDPVKTGANGSPSQFNFEITPTVSGDYHFELIASADVPADWTHSYSIDGISYTADQTISLEKDSSTLVGIEITPGTTNALEEYTLLAYPVQNPGTQITQKVYVIKGITELIVNGSGTSGDGNNYNWESIYADGIESTSSSNTYAITSAEVMTMAVNSDALTDVGNIYMNIGWTFPSFSDDDANALMNFMDGGGNVFVSGQDIGWDINDPNGYGTTITRRLYSSYLHAFYLSDDAGENSLYPVSTDDVFGSLPTVDIVDRYNGNFYPEHISPMSGADAIFRYDTAMIGGLRYESSDYKVVYLGVGLEMIQDETIRSRVLELSHNWFHNMISTEEFTDEFRKLSVYPNPAKDRVKLEVEKDGEYSISLTNVAGQEVQRSVREVTSGDNTLELHLGRLPSGVYTLKISNDQYSQSRKIIVE